MPPDHIFQDALEAGKAFLAAIVPPALGSAVAAWIRQELTWSERLQRFVIGAVVSYYVMLAVQAAIDPDPFFANSISFSVGLIAADLLPRLRETLLEAAGEVLPRLLDFIRRRKGPDA